jgi:hypothetical protein
VLCFSPHQQPFRAKQLQRRQSSPPRALTHQTLLRRKLNSSDMHKEVEAEVEAAGAQAAAVGPAAGEPGSPVAALVTALAPVQAALAPVQVVQEVM